MSHISKIELRILSLSTLEKACEKLGAKLYRDVKTHKWFGRWVGDSPLPEGMEKEDIGKCDHVIRINNATEMTYEVGVIKSKTHAGYELFYDNWEGGYGLEKVLGKNLGKLKQQYTAETILKKIKMKKEVIRVQESQNEGKMRFEILVK